MGSIGLALRKGVSFHGLALNVNLDLTPFSWIQPCGLQGVQMTSMQQELSREVSMTEVRNVFKDKFESVLGIHLYETSLSIHRFGAKAPLAEATASNRVGL
jgi:lipoate-protein ligase B